MEEKKEIVKLSNRLAEAKYGLGVQEQKIFLYAISMIEDEDENLNVIKFRLIDYAKKSNSDIKQLYKDIDKITDNLMSVFFKIKYSDTKWEKYNLMSKCGYDNGVLMIKFDEDMKPFLLELKERYSSHLLDVPIKFKNKYAIRTYQILKANAYKNTPIEYDYQEFREMIGIDKGKYKSFNNFRIRILETAKKEIDLQSDIFFTYEKIAKGRKVVGIRFKIEKVSTSFKKLHEALDFSEIIEDIKKKSGLQNERFNSEQIIQLYEISVMKTQSQDIDPYEYIRINYKNMMNKSTARNKFGWLKKALEEDYGSAAAQIRFDIEIV